MQSIQPISNFTGGRDRSVHPFRADPNTFHTLHNLRQSRRGQGCIEQVPFFVVQSQESAGTYYDGGSQSEPATSAVRMLARASDVNNLSQTNFSLAVTDHTVRRGSLTSFGTQVPVFYQTTQPAAETTHTGCLLVINNVSGLGITLGNTLDVEMTGAAAFRWRKNGGGWTAGVPSTTGVAIDGGNATLYFLENGGFAGTETWAWTRTDASFEPASSSFWRARTFPWITDGNDILFINKNDRVMRATVGSAGTLNDIYVISTGYRAVYAGGLVLFNKLLVLQDAGTTLALIGARVRTYKNSDRNDYDNFIATDVNEADTHMLDYQSSHFEDFVFGVGMAVLGQYLYVVTASTIYYTADNGLPLGLVFQHFQDRAVSIGPSSVAIVRQSVVPARGGIFILSTLNVVFFDGSQFTDIGTPVRDLLATDCHGIYNNFLDELIIVGTAENGIRIALCYQTKYRTWYTRAVHFGTSGTTGPTALATNTGTFYCGTASLRILVEDSSWGNAALGSPVADANGAYTTPTVVLQPVPSRSFAPMNEIAGTYIAMSGLFGSFTPSATHYATPGVLRFKVSWSVTNDGTIGTMSTDAAATLSGTALDGVVSYPRLSGRSIALQVELTVSTGTKPPAAAMIAGIEPQIRTRPLPIR